MQDPLTVARDALARHEFVEAAAAFAAASLGGGMSADDLQSWGEAAWWSGDADTAVAAMEAAFGAYVADGLRPEAVAMAARLFELATRRRAHAVAGGWAARAERLLEGEPQGPAHAWLAVIRGFTAMIRDGDLERALAAVDDGIALARAHGVLDVESLLGVAKGAIMVRRGDWSGGLALIDEATASAVAGLLHPKIACDVYCFTIATCRDVTDFRRASEWVEEADRWMKLRGLQGYRGICRVHRAELRRLRGEWPAAEQEARAAGVELEAFRLLDGVAFASREVGEVRLRMGDLASAEEAFRRAHEFGSDAQPGWSLLLLARGKPREAFVSVERAAAALAQRPVVDVVDHARLLPARVAIAIAAGEPDTAHAATEQLEDLAQRFDSGALRASALSARGSLLLAAGETARAAEVLDRARHAWQELELPFETAQARLDRGRALLSAGAYADAELELQAARTVFERLGAGIEVAHANAALAEQAQQSGRPRRAVTKTFLFTDIVGSTDLARVIGDAWPKTVEWHDRLLRRVFADHRGEVVRHTGDGFFVAFGDAAEAIAAAADVQRQLAEARDGHPFAPSVRIGLHEASASRHEGDYAGHGVHVAARIAALAGAGEIVASRRTLEAALADAPNLPVSAAAPRSVELKGAEGPVEVVTLDWA